jgi:hypothetical protein
MLHIELPRRTALSLLTGLALLVPTTLGAAAAPEETPLQSPAPVVAAASLPSPDHPQIVHVTGGFEIDSGGPGILFERLAEDGD